MEASMLEKIVFATLVISTAAALYFRRDIMNLSYKNFPYLGRQPYSGHLYETKDKER